MPVRVGQEVQEMPRALIWGWLAASVAQGAVWPPALDDYRRVSAAAWTPPEAEKAVWAEYGLEEAEKAVFESKGRRLEAVAYRLKDSTAAIAAFQWRQPEGGQAIRKLDFGVWLGRRSAGAFGNYLLQFEGGYRPSGDEFRFWAERLPGYRRGPTPTLPGFLPVENRLAGSERYILGPASLAAFLPGVELGTEAFEQFQCEGQAVRYRTPEGTSAAALFRFPTPAIAKDYLPRFQKVAGVRARRSGPAVTLVFPPAGEAAAARILDQTNFDVLFDFTDTVPTKMPDVGGLLVGIFALTGVILVVALGGGLVVAGLLFLRARGRSENENQAMTTLHLER